MLLQLSFWDWKILSRPLQIPVFQTYSKAWIMHPAQRGFATRPAHIWYMSNSFTIYLEFIYIHLTYNLVLRYLPMWFCHDLCDVSFVSCIKSNHMFIYLIGSDFFKLNNSPAKTHLKGKVISIFLLENQLLILGVYTQYIMDILLNSSSHANGAKTLLNF